MILELLSSKIAFKVRGAPFTRLTPIGALGNLFQGGHLAWRCSDRRGHWPLRRSPLGQLGLPARPRLRRPGWEPRPQGTPSGRAGGGGEGLRTANGVSPPRTLAASPALPGAWGAGAGAGAGQRYTTGSVSRRVGNSNQLAAGASHPRPQPRAAPATRLHIPTLLGGNEHVFDAVPNTSSSSSATFHSHPCGQPFKCRLAATLPLHATPSTTCKTLRNGRVADHTYRFLTARACRSPTWSRVSWSPSAAAEVRSGEAAPEASGSQSGSPRPCSGMNTLATGNYNSQHPSGPWRRAIARDHLLLPGPASLASSCTLLELG